MRRGDMIGSFLIGGLFRLPAEGLAVLNADRPHIAVPGAARDPLALRGLHPIGAEVRHRSLTLATSPDGGGLTTGRSQQRIAYSGFYWAMQSAKARPFRPPEFRC